MAHAFAIETEGLSKALGGRPIVREVGLAVPRGSVFGFLGPNGAGKTTVMRLLVGLLKPDAGNIRLLGSDLAENRKALMGRIGAFIETPGLYENLSGRENLKLACRLRGIDTADISRVLGIVAMEGAADRRVRSYSLGMKQRLALARALLGNPALLLLDEPTNGLDPEGIMAMRELIRDLPQRIDATVFLSSHLLGEVEEVVDSIALLREGKLIAQGKLSALGSTSARLKITVDRAPDALALLLAHGLRVEPGSAANDLCVTYDRYAENIDPAEINRRLVSAGIGVSALAQERLGLEHLYREVMGPRPAMEGEAA
ncbi:ATP-binding cassette domain-containing protein [Citromicrobium bathyomarinum]|uniref:ATP-binding cassette domain-containing protein n=1 Tax=Citromicrobium bathyomarinum TaxID=72174 RepID=UPI003159EF74